MKLHRFYIEIPLKDQREVEIKNHELINQWKNVLRFEEGDKIILFDNSGYEFLFFIKEITDKRVRLVLLEEKKVAPVARYDLHLIPALIKRDMFELVLQKITELGVEKILPLLAERSIKNKLNLERSKSIIKEAAEQSGKTIIPEITAPEKLEVILKNREVDRFYMALNPKGEKFSKKILTNKNFNGLSQLNADQGASEKRTETYLQYGEGASERSNAEMRRMGKSIGVFIGPEGGFTEKEIAEFKKNNIPVVSFGNQILRAETAAIALVSILQIADL